MTISDTATKFRYEGNAVTDTFAFSAKAFTESDLIVEIITRATDALEETLTITTDYTVTINGDETATIVTVPAKIPSATQDIQIRRSLAQTQAVELPTGTKFPAKSVENALDRAVGLSQDLEESVVRSLKFPTTSSTTTATLPEPVDDSTILFDGTSGTFKIGPTATEIDTAESSAIAAAASAAAAASSEASAASSAAAAAASAAAADTYPTLTNSGLQITVGAFAILDSSGLAVDVAEQSITMQASSVQYLVVDLNTLSIKVLDRAYHDGAITIAELTSDTTNITKLLRLWSGEKPKTKISAFLTRLDNSRVAGDIRIALLGDSLLEPAGSGVRWDDLLFDTAQVGLGYNVTKAANITVDNYAIGSQTSHYGVVYAAKESIESGSGAFQDTQLIYTPSEQALRFFPASTNVVQNPFFAQPYDLIILGFGANGGTEDLLYYENLIAQLRRTGSDVVVVTQNYRTDNAAFLKARGDDLKRICDNFGCALVDTWMYVLEEERSGSTVHADVIHMAQAGHNAWAEALSGVIDPSFVLEPDVLKPPYRRVYGNIQAANGNAWNLAASSAHVQFEPNSTTGTANQSTTVTGTNKNPAIIFGGKSTSNAVTSLAPGEIASYGHPWANSVDVIVDGANTFTAEINSQNNATQLATFELTSAVSGRAITIEGVAPTTYANIATQFRRNRGIQIECLTGTLDILGVVFHCDPVTQLNIDKDVTYNGTWSTEAWINGHPYSYFSDTDNDSFSFEFEGSEAVVYLSSRSAAGIVDVYVNGKLIYNQFDLFNAGSFVDSIWIPGSGSSTQYEDRLPGKHSVQIYRNGLNGGASASAASNRRLQLLGIDVFQRS